MEDLMICTRCGKKFKVVQGANNFPGGLMKEDIKCPYCGAHNGYITTSTMVQTFKIES